MPPTVNGSVTVDGQPLTASASYALASPAASSVPGSAFTTLAFADEFGESALAPVWNVNQDNLPYDLSQDLPANVFLRDGQMVIAAKKETTPAGRAWSTGYIDTRPLGANAGFAQKFGVFEASIKVPTTLGDSAGLWPAFWLRPNGGAVSGELDIMEAWGEPSTTRTDYPVGKTCCSILSDTNHVDNRKKSIWCSSPRGRMSDGFHTYALEWSPDHFAMYIDGVLQPYGLVPFTDAGLGFPAANFNAPFHVRLQVQVGQPAYWGVPNAATKPYSEMLVDWVRVWTK